MEKARQALDHELAHLWTQFCESATDATRAVRDAIKVCSPAHAVSSPAILKTIDMRGVASWPCHKTA